MTATAPETTENQTDADYVDVDVGIVGAGFSGIGAAHRIHERNPGLSYVILERRDRTAVPERVRRDPQLLVDLLCSPLNGAVQPPAAADSGASAG